MNEKVDTHESNQKIVDSSRYRIQNEPLLINEVFLDGIFNNFNRYCYKNNMNNMGDLHEFDFNSLTGIRGFGTERVSRITSKYVSIMFDYQSNPAVEDKRSHLSFKDMLIESVFLENRYDIFRDYCSIHEITTIVDLEHFNFDDLLNEKGIGVGKIAQIRSKFLEIISFENMSLYMQPTLSNFGSESGIHTATVSNADKVQQYNIHKDYYEIDISFAFEEKICRVFRAKNINNIQDLRYVVSNDFRFVSGMGEKRIKEALDTIKFLELPIKEFVTTSFTRIRQESEYPFYSEVVYGKKTLEEVGIAHNITR